MFVSALYRVNDMCNDNSLPNEKPNLKPEWKVDTPGAGTMLHRRGTQFHCGRSARPPGHPYQKCGGVAGYIYIVRVQRQR